MLVLLQGQTGKFVTDPTVGIMKDMLDASCLTAGLNLDTLQTALVLVRLLPFTTGQRLDFLMNTDL